MQISRINDIRQFDQLRASWESVYAADAHAGFYMSWMRLRGWFEIIPYTWFVLAVRPDAASPYVAFFPLNIRLLRVQRFSLIRELRMGGKPLGGYTGFVCLPEYEEKAIATLAYHIQQRLDWDSFQMEHILDPRLDLFLECFARERFVIEQVQRTASSYIPLPDTWDQYLQDSLGSRTRRNLRRSLRQVESNNELHTTSVQKDSVERDIEILLTLWQKRWGPDPKATWQRDFLRYSFENNCLWLNVLWDGPTPIAALAGVIDRQKKAFYALVIGCDTSRHAKLSPGKVMFGYSIKYAIENGIQMYDLVMGQDAYKFSLGAKRRTDAVTTVIARKNLRSKVANTGLDLARQLRDLRKKWHHYRQKSRLKVNRLTTGSVNEDQPNREHPLFTRDREL